MTEWRSSGKGYGYWYPDIDGSRSLSFNKDRQEVVVSGYEKYGMHPNNFRVAVSVTVLAELLAEAGYQIVKVDND